MSRRTDRRTELHVHRRRGEGVLHCEQLRTAGRVTPRAREQALLTSAPLEATANDDGIAPSFFAAIAIPFHPLSPIHRLDRLPSSFSPLLPPLAPQRSTKPGHTPTNNSSIGCCDESEREREKRERGKKAQRNWGTTCSIAFSPARPRPRPARN